MTNEELMRREIKNPFENVISRKKVFMDMLYSEKTKHHILPSNLGIELSRKRKSREAKDNLDEVHRKMP